MTPELFLTALGMMVMDAFHWTVDNWAVLTLIYFPAFMGYLNGFIAAARVMGYTRMADWFGKLERAMQAFVDEVRRQKRIEKQERQEEKDIASKEEKK